MFRKLSKFFTYASLFSVTIVLTNTFFPFIGGKDYFFRISVELGLACALLWWAFEAKEGEVKTRGRELFRNPIVIAVSLFVAAFLLSSLFADYPWGAFWSNYERGEGGFQMVHYYFFFMLLAFFFKEKRDWEWLFKLSAIVAGLMVLYGVASAVITVNSGGTLGNPWGLVSVYATSQGPVAPSFLGRLFSSEVRFQGSLGNPAYVAPYLIFIIFYCLYLAVHHPRRKWWWMGAAAASLVFLVLTQTRGAFIGFIAAVFAFLFYSIRHREGKARLAARLALWGFTLLNWFLAFGVLRVKDVDTAAGRSTQGFWGFMNRLYNIGFSWNQLVALFIGSIVVIILLDLLLTLRKQGSKVVVALALAFIFIGGMAYVRGHREFLQTDNADSIVTRVWAWGSAWKGFEGRPLLGWGAENFPTVFDKYFNTQYFIPGKATETWFDRAHSVFFDYLAETGILGFATYVGMFIVFFWEFGRRSRERGHNVVSRGLMMALPVGYLVQGLVLFDVLPIYLNLFVFFAFARWWLGEGEIKRSRGTN